MFPGGINPKQMGKMMRQMGIKNEDLEVEEITMKLKNGKKLVFKEPQVQSIEMQGTKTYTVMGNPSEESGVPDDDVEMVAEQANVSKEKAKKALEESNGDIAEAIMKLKK
ncbi:MAG: nascent polypeptide-associated complex protein [archaeon]|jgi:nascent polypeptide-associated complex subunit alpha